MSRYKNLAKVGKHARARALYFRGPRHNYRAGLRVRAFDLHGFRGTPADVAARRRRAPRTGKTGLAIDSKASRFRRRALRVGFYFFPPYSWKFTYRPRAVWQHKSL